MRSHIRPPFGDLTVLAGVLASLLLLAACGAEDAGPAAGSSPSPSSPAAASPELVEGATRVMQELQAGNYDAILDLMHYPPDYTEEQLAEDRRALAAGFAFVMSELGPLQSFEPQAEPVEFYHVGFAMGTPEYWAGLPANGLAAGYAFRTRHEKAGSGLVQITYTLAGGSMQIRSLQIGVPAAAPGAQALFERIGPAALERLQPATPAPAAPDAPGRGSSE